MDDGPTTNSRARRDLYLDLSATHDTRSRGRSFSQGLPSVLASTSPISLSSPASPQLPVLPTGSKARGELKKLLAHLLSKLKTRPPAPSVYDSIKADSTRKESYRLGAVVETVRSAVRFKSNKEHPDPNDKPAEEEEAVENDQDYSTDVTYNLMAQLRDIVILSARQGWQIFERTEAEADISQRENSSLRRLRRNSRQLGQRSRSPSLNDRSKPPDLLLECINILASVISEDCRFRMSSPRVFRPPYSLQSVSLDIAQSLINTNRHDAKILSRIGFAMIPAFSSFSPALHTRLLTFFEDGIMRGMLDDLQSFQGFEQTSPKDAVQEDPPTTKPPVVAIQVEEAVDDDTPPSGQQGWLQWSSASTPIISGFLSTVAPSQPLAIYHLSSLVPPLLVAILDVIDLFEDNIKDITRFHRFHALLRTIITLKRDSYLDILEVVAYHGPQTRRRALAVLATFWPKSLGHVVIGKSLPIISPADSLPNQTPSAKLKFNRQSRDHPYAHEFMPWRFFRQDSSSALDYGIIRSSCQSCSGAIIGFGLLCPFCLTAVHLNCYDAPDGTFHGQYPTDSETSHRQCFVSFSDTLSPRRDMEPDIVMKAQHAFRMANLFTLALCLVCRKPLWGHVKQGMKCSSCMQFVHSTCLSTTSSDTFPSCSDFTLSESHVTIDWDVLRRSFIDHYEDVLIIQKELPTKTYEDVSILYSILWAQLCIFENGIVYKSIIVNQRNPKTPPAKENQVDEFELQYFVKLYEAFLSSGSLVMSYTLREYHDLNKDAPFNEHTVLFDWTLLANVTSIIKTPLSSHPSPVSSPSNFLHVNDHDLEKSLEPPSHPYELVLLSHMRNALGLEFQVHLDHAARYMLSHISHIGFFDRIDLNTNLFDDPTPSQVFCSFPLPSGLDLSTSVETLVVAIEACLEDIDVAVNEYGFLLLVRRFWPTGAASEYALTRLTKTVLSWILAEDDRLVVIARDHIARNLSLPGVRTAHDSSPWPSMSRHTSNKGVHSGGEYVLCRKQLLVRHALPWLAAVHALDTSLYTSSIYRQCVDVADASDSRQIVSSLYSSKIEKQDADLKIAWGEAMLRSIIKLAQSNATLSSFEETLVSWFDAVASPGTSVDSLTFKSLPRLFNREGDPSRRTSTLNDASLGLLDSIDTDPWKTFDTVASEGLGGLERSLMWLRAMAHSAVDIPTQVLKHMFGLARQFQASFPMVVSLLESTMAAMWLKTFGNDGLDLVMMEVNDIWADDLLKQMSFAGEIEEILNFLRFSLVTCLLVYGCERQTIISLGLILPSELRYLPQRRKIARVSTVPTTLEINPKLVAILSRYVTEGPDRVCVIVAKFLHTLVSESALLETHEIDHFILVNGDALSQCAWRFYDLNSQDLNDVRTSFLLRILVVDPQPFDSLLRGILYLGGNWQVRFQAITRLFRIVLDVTSPSFGVEGRQWKSNVTDVLNHFFRSLWVDDCEEIRLGVDTWVRTLLPAHLQIISSCWNEHMSKSPIADRAKLSAFLVQLHPHFPAWQLLSWETIVEVLLDDDFVQSNGEDEDGYAAAAHLSVYGYPSPSGERTQASHNNDPDVVALRVSLLLLSLQMIADGIAVDLVHLLKIKLMLAKILGFHSTSLQPSPSGQAFHVIFEGLEEIHALSFSCINPLMRVLDAPHALSLPPSSMGVTWNEVPVLGLVGDIFIDVVISLLEKTSIVQTLPYSVLRGLLESMLLIIVKHDINGLSLRHLDETICRAVKTVTDLAASDVSYDIRHLCLSVMQTFMQDYPVLALKILGHQVQVLTRLATSLHFSPDDSLVVQSREFLEAAFIQYEVSGLFWLLSKQGRMSDDFFVMLRNIVTGASSGTEVPGETLRDSIIRDTLSKVAANTNDRAIPDVLYNLEKYVSVCHHQSFPTSLIQHIGLRLTAIARQTADSTPATNRSSQPFDPNPLLLMSATIVQHNKAQSIDLLLHTETLLRSALVRFDVRPETLERLLHVVSTMYRRSKTVDVNGTQFPVNHIAMGVLEVLSDVLRGKTRVLPSTMTGMLEAVVSLHVDQSAYIPTSTVIRAGADAISYLNYSSYRETYGQPDFSASLAAAKLILHVSNHDPNLLAQSLVGDTRSSPPVRVWNLVALAALRTPGSDASAKLLALLPSFVLVYITSLKVPPSGIFDDSIAPNVNHAFASVKLWMLIARKSGHEIDVAGNASVSDSAERMVWNDLWPSFERLLVLSLADGPNGEMPPLLTFLWGCVSDLMLFVRQTRSVVALDTSSHASILNKLRASSRGEAAGSKFARAIRSISEPPADLSFDLLVTQVTSDVLTAEKLQAIETYKQGGADRRREHADRRKVEGREVRTVS